MRKTTMNRRGFLAAMTSTVAGIATAENKPNTARVVPGKISPNEKLNIASIGVGGMGRNDVRNCGEESIVALCDVDSKEASESFERFPDARRFTDYRKMLDTMKEIDAVTISTPDHTHAPAAYMAMQLGKHVYVQKPLAHTIAEIKLLMRTAREMGVATQMGNQGHSGNGVRELCEMVWSGAIGKIREVHAWTFRPKGRWPQGVPAPLPPMEVPAHLEWDLWLGTAAHRPYNEKYCPHNWRGWYDFGNGALGDMGCHVLDPVYWSLKLGDAPSYSVEIVDSDPRNDHTYPTSEVLKFTFAARGDMPPVEVYWHDGGRMPPRPAGIAEEERLGDGQWNGETDGSYFIGEGGILTTGTYGSRSRLVPKVLMKEYKKPEPSIPRIDHQDHTGNWIQACKGGEPACSNFDYSGPFATMILLGGLAMRLGKSVEWDSQKQAITNLANGQDLISKTYRPGWELPV